MSKTMRTAFIRVSSKNDTKKGLIEYSDEDIKEKVLQVASWQGVEYWYIKHDVDEEVSQVHWHIVFRFANPVQFESLKVIFEYGDIENAKRIKASVQYLVHQNDESKKQYDWKEVVTNCKDLTKYKIKSDSQNEVTIYKVLERIEKGDIREYNQFTEINIDLWSKYKSRIENGLTYYREKICMNKDRKIEVIFMSGQTGSGKTTFAKRYCECTNKSCCISSSSNDIMQDYKGEDVLILDDLRDDSFSFTDLLKILDNHTKSTIKSRYHNKAFIGDMIIITSYRPITDWYFNIEKENKEQLYRRVKTWYKFYNDEIEIFEYQNNRHKYVRIAKTKNVVIEQGPSNEKCGLKMLEDMNIQVEEEKDTKFEQMSLEDVNIFNKE